jgi:hypothetical protein
MRIPPHSIRRYPAQSQRDPARFVTPLGELKDLGNQVLFVLATANRNTNRLGIFLGDCERFVLGVEGLGVPTRSAPAMSTLPNIDILVASRKVLFERVFVASRKVLFMGDPCFWGVRESLVIFPL